MQHPAKGIVEVPLGFSWPALLLGPMWAIVKRLWLVFGFLLLALILITFVDLYSKASHSIALTVVPLVFYIAYMYVCGKYANAWWRWTLERRGFQLVREQR